MIFSRCSPNRVQQPCGVGQSPHLWSNVDSRSNVKDFLCAGRAFHLSARGSVCAARGRKLLRESPDHDHHLTDCVRRCAQWRWMVGCWERERKIPPDAPLIVSQTFVRPRVKLLSAQRCAITSPYTHAEKMRNPATGRALCFQIDDFFARKGVLKCTGFKIVFFCAIAIIGFAFSTRFCVMECQILVFARAVVKFVHLCAMRCTSSHDTCLPHILLFFIRNKSGMC